MSHRLHRYAWVAAIAGLGLAPGCVCGNSHALPAGASRDFGDTGVAPPDATQAAAYLALARAVVEHKGRAAVPAPPAGTGRRVMLAYYHPGLEPLVATASGATL